MKFTVHTTPSHPKKGWPRDFNNTEGKRRKTRSKLFYTLLILHYNPCLSVISTLFETVSYTISTHAWVHSIVWPSKLTHGCILHFSLYMFQRCPKLSFLSLKKKLYTIRRTFIFNQNTSSIASKHTLSQNFKVWKFTPPTPQKRVWFDQQYPLYFQ